MNPNDIRINARLSGQDAIHFRAMLEQSGRSASDLLREALREYHASQLGPRREPVALLADFVGAGEGPEDLSSRYKHYLAEGLADKLHGAVHDHDDLDR